MNVGGSNGRNRSGARQTRPKSAGAAGRKPAVANGRSGHGRASANSLNFTIPSDYNLGNDVQMRILEVAQKVGFAGDSFFALRIALEEALVNAIKHGNRHDPAKKVHVEAHFSAKRAEILIEDEGPGFDRKSVPDPTAEENLCRCSGRGILLIETYMNEVKWDRGGRRLFMVKEQG